MSQTPTIIIIAVLRTELLRTNCNSNNRRWKVLKWEADAGVLTSLKHRPPRTTHMTRAAMSDVMPQVQTF